MIVDLDNVLIPTIDDWWVIGENDEGDTFLTRYINLLQEEKNRDPKEYKARWDELRKQFFNSYPNLVEHFQALADHSEEQHLMDIKYLPHLTEYAYRTFLKLDGFKRLQSLCEQMQNVSMSVVLQPHKRADVISEEHSHHLYIVFQSMDHEPLQDKANKIKSLPHRTIN